VGVVPGDARRALVALAAVLAGAAAGPAGAVAAPPPPIGAPAAIVIDARTGETLFARRAHDERAIASTTKLMTAMLALERANPGDVFAAPPYAAAAVESKIGLRTGERMTVRDLVRAAMLPSANDAANALAVNIGGTRARFVRLMNARARAVGLRETHYSTPIGLDDPSNYSSAYDLARLSARLLRDPTFARVVNMPAARLRSGLRPRTVLNRNLLVRRYPFVDGVKTGHTLQAGYVLVGAAHGGGAKVVSVVLGAPSEAARDADSLALLRWGVAEFRRVKAVRAGKRYARASVRWHDDEKVDLVAARDVTLSVRRGDSVTRRVDAPDEVEGPLAKGSRVGAVRVVHDGKVVRTVPLVTASPVEGAGLLRRAASSLGGPLPALAFVGLVGATAFLGLRVRATRGTRRGKARSR
jgi:D-alanyl-D-alanine carboxypeptidase (penicillin-binding protein 5/6)